jgi:predicted ABC-class ATPase
MNIETPPDLGQILLSLDGKGYKAYKCLQGRSYEFSPFRMTFEHVQGDPFAFPSRIAIEIDLTDAGFDPSFYDSRLRRLGLEDYLLRELHRNIAKTPGSIRGSGKSGEIGVQTPSQKILKRSALLIRENRLRLLMFAGLPADGRRILGKECLRLFAEVLPPLWSNSLLAESLDLVRVRTHLETLEDYDALQRELESNRWITFVANGSNLPRESGISDRPLKKNAVPFIAPTGLSAIVKLPHKGRVEGMPIPEGITLIVGGGFHGKSTLLRAVQDAVYPHIPGDGRELIATVPSAVKIRAEDGRSVRHIDVSGFMNRLPLVESTRDFSTQSASGSTSQAVNILEAIESGSRLLLMDEDTCATNFMIRDARMQLLISSSMEPITPYLDRVEEIYRTLQASTLLVMGGSGDYFDVANQVIAMEEFRPRLVTGEARKIVNENPGDRKREVEFPLPPVRERRAGLDHLNFSRGKKDCVIQTRGRLELILGRTSVDTRYVEQLVEEGQLEMCGWILSRLKSDSENGSLANFEGLRLIFREIEERGFDPLLPYNNGLLTLPRLQEVMAVLNRIR